ncbi:MAG TPA: zinc-binding dehydrogenase [Acidimicrobiales bacterium]|nr:zinc-binding dehydrogenase [Acidimicrobiales bacterium]
MHAIRLHEYGPAENMRYEDVPDPRPHEGEVLIAVEAAGVHLVDTAVRAGVARGPVPLPELPTIPGREVAGTVGEVGPGADEDWQGRRVVAHLGPGGSGGYAALAVAGVDALHRLPDNVSAATAVAMIGTGRTAMAILDVAALTPDDVVLVTAAAGGLGSLFVQAARRVGAVAVGVAGGPDKVERVRALGAPVAVDYDQPDWTDQVRRALGDRPVTVVLEGVGGDLGRAAMELLGVGGRLVMFGWASADGKPTAVTTEDIVAKGLTVSWAIGPRVAQRPGGVRGLEARALEEAAAGRLTPVVQTSPLAEAAAAHRALETRGTVGKVVLVP